MARHLSCAICGAGFTANHSQARYCGAECAREGMRASWRKYDEKNKHRRRASAAKHYDKISQQVIARTRAYQRTEKGKAAQRATDARQRVLSPEKIAARQAVKIALASGRLKRQPCEVCGATKSQSHHDDYSKPIEVRWLCVKCHTAHHKRKSRRLRGIEI